MRVIAAAIGVANSDAVADIILRKLREQVRETEVQIGKRFPARLYADLDLFCYEVKQSADDKMRVLANALQRHGTQAIETHEERRAVAGHSLAVRALHPSETTTLLHEKQESKLVPFDSETEEKRRESLRPRDWHKVAVAVQAQQELVLLDFRKRQVSSTSGLKPNVVLKHVRLDGGEVYSVLYLCTGDGVTIDGEKFETFGSVGGVALTSRNPYLCDNPHKFGAILSNVKGKHAVDDPYKRIVYAVPAHEGLPFSIRDLINGQVVAVQRGIVRSGATWRISETEYDAAVRACERQRLTDNVKPKKSSAKSAPTAVLSDGDSYDGPSDVF